MFRGAHTFAFGQKMVEEPRGYRQSVLWASAARPSAATHVWCGVRNTCVWCLRASNRADEAVLPRIAAGEYSDDAHNRELARAQQQHRRVDCPLSKP